MPSQDPPRAATPAMRSALPSVGARVLAFAAVLLGGACGGLIGWSLVRLQCTGNCQLVEGLGGLVGAVVTALGTAVLAVLVLRAMTEWRSLPPTAFPGATRGARHRRRKRSSPRRRRPARGAESPPRG